MRFLLIVSLVLAILALVFALQNTDPATIGFLVWEVETSIAVALVVSMAAGAAVALLAVSPALVGGRWRLSSQSRKAGRLEQDLARCQSDLQAARSQIEELQASASGESDTPA